METFIGVILLYFFALFLTHAVRGRGDSRSLGLVGAILLVPSLWLMILRGGWEVRITDTAHWWVFPVKGEGGAVIGVLDLISASVVVSLLYFTATVFVFLLGRWARLKGQAGLTAMHRSLMKLLVVAIGFVVYLKALGFSLTPLLFGMGAVSIVVGFALQEPLSNLFTGLSLDFEGTLLPGDWIKIEGEQKTVGRVVDKGWRATRLVTMDNISVTVPNKMLGSQKVINYHRPDALHAHRLKLSASYRDPPLKVKEVMRAVLLSIPEIEKEPPPLVLTSNYAADGIEYELRFFLRDYGASMAVCDEILTRVWYALRENSIVVPYPSRTVYLKSSEEVNGEDLALKRGRDELESFLRTLPFLSKRLSPDDFDFLAVNSCSCLYEAGEPVLLKGQSGDAVYVVKSGHCEVKMPTGEVKSLSVGDYFGEMALLQKGARTADVCAGGEGADVVRIDRESMVKLFEKHPELFAEIVRTTDKRRLESGMEEESKVAEKEAGFWQSAGRALFPWH